MYELSSNQIYDDTKKSIFILEDLIGKKSHLIEHLVFQLLKKQMGI